LLVAEDPEGKLIAPALPAPTKVLEPQTARSTIDMLEKVVEQGGIGLNRSYPAGASQENREPRKLRNGKGYGYLHAISFIGMAPAEDRSMSWR
jgi:hypothetical protein